MESWSAFGAKFGARGVTGGDRVAGLVRDFANLPRHVPGLQANFEMGLDEDEGGEPFDMTADFIEQTPFVWPNINIRTPYGGTPMPQLLRRPLEHFAAPA